MSAFVVTHETMNRAVFAMTHRDYGTMVAAEDCDSLGDRMFALNVQAVNARYSEQAGHEETFRYHGKQYSKFVALKSLDCLIYQCSEGDVPKLDLYQQMVRRRDEMCREIVMDLPEYKAAAWGAN